MGKGIQEEICLGEASGKIVLPKLNIQKGYVCFSFLCFGLVTSVMLGATAAIPWARVSGLL